MMFLFVYRRLMDFDQMAPVAWKLATAGHRVGFFSMNPDIHPDDLPVGQILAKAGAELGSVYEAFTPSPAHRAAALAATRGWTSLWTHEITSRILTRLYDVDWATGVLKSLDVECLIMDWARIDSRLTAPLTRAARRLGVPTFSLPHGVDHVDDDAYFAPLMRGLLEHFDYIVTPNAIRHRILLSGGMNRDRVAILGSARYCDEWARVLDAWFGEGAGTTPSAKLRVVIFDSGVAEEAPSIATLVERLDSIRSVEVVVQPKPGRTVLSGLLGRYKLKRTKVDAATPSSLLNRWADVVCGTSSSVLLESFVLQKHLLWLRFIDNMRSGWGIARACWIADDEMDACNILSRLAADRGLAPCSSEQIENFAVDCLLGGVSGRRVLDDYKNFIIARKRHPEFPRNDAYQSTMGR